MKKILLVIVLVLMFTMTNANAEVIQSNKYIDMDILEGEEEEKAALTRYELCKVIVNAAGLDYMVPQSKSIYADAHDSEFDGYVAVATGLGFISGYADGTFRGEELVSVDDASLLILLLMK